jgi:hypothetical protein
MDGPRHARDVFHRGGGLLACSHVSGLIERPLGPQALMASADRRLITASGSVARWPVQVCRSRYSPNFTITPLSPSQAVAARRYSDQAVATIFGVL